MLQYFINKYKINKKHIFKFGLEALIGISYSLTKEVKYLNFFKEEIVIINIELSLYLNPLIFKNWVYSIKQQLGVKKLNRFQLFYYYVYIFLGITFNKVNELIRALHIKDRATL